MTKNGSRRRWLWAAVCAAGVVAAILLYVATRPEPPVEPVLEEEAVDPPAPVAPGWVDEPGEPPEFPEGVRWLAEDTFVETGRGGRGMVSRWDADGDGLYDADEFMMYGTLRYDARTRTSATRIDILPHGSTEVLVSTRTREGMRFRRMAKRPLTPEEDTDGDGLPDAWEMHWFGHLDYGPYDDPDGDGFPNIIEWYRGTDPTTPDILAPSMRPAELEDVPEPETPWCIRWDVHSRQFWEIQDRLRAKLKAEAEAEAEASGP